MKSFLRYCIDADLREMTFDPIASLRQAKEPDEMTHEKRKVPIHGDMDDIIYLHQFPPSFWAQALVYRYNEKLFETEKAIKNNKQVKDVEDVILRDSHGPVLFKNIKTGAAKLHDKLTKDVDDITLSQMKKTPEDRARYSGSGSGHYGLDLSGDYKHKQLRVGEGYIGMTLPQAKKFLDKWFRGVRSGWLGSDPKQSERRPVKKGGKGRSVYSFEGLENHPMRGKRFHITQDGRGQWYGWRIIDGEIADKPTVYTEYLPVLHPAKSVDKKAYDKHNSLRKIANQVHSKAVAIDKALKDNPNMPLSKALKMAFGKRWEDYHAIIDPDSRNQLAKEYEELKYKLKRQGPAKEGQYISSREQTSYKNRMEHIEHILGIGDAFDDNFETVTAENLPVVLTWIGDELHKHADEIRRTAPRYDAHDWNVHKFSTIRNDPNNPFSGFVYPKLHHKNVIGFGTFNTNKQQKERLHAGVLTRGYNPEEIRDELMPYLVQAGTQPATDNPDGGHIPYVLSRPSDPRKIRKKRDLPQEDRRRSPLAIGINRFLQKPNVFGDSPTFIAMRNNWWLIFQNAADDLWGRIGSREFLDYLDAKKTGNIDHLESALQNLEKFAEQTGENYARSIYQVTKRQQKTSLDQPVGPGGESLGELLSHEDNKIHDAIAQGSFSFNRVLRGAEADFHTTGHDISELKKVIARASAEAAGAIETPQTDDPEMAAQQTKMMRNIIDAGVAFQAYRDYYIWNKIAEKKAKIARGETPTEEDEWTMQDANAYAAREVEKYQREKQIPAYGGEITAATSRSIASLSAKEREEERSLRERIRRAQTLGTASGIKTGEDVVVSTAVTFLNNLRDAKTDAEKAKYLQHLFTYANGMRPSDPGYDNILDAVRGVVDDLGTDYINNLGVQLPKMVAMPAHAEMPEYAQRMVRLATNPKFVATLDKNAPQFNPQHRQAFEQWVEKQHPGWQMLQQALERADLGTKRPTG